MLFLAVRHINGVPRNIFLAQDPRPLGFTGPVQGGVRVEDNPDRNTSWPTGNDRPEVALGRHPGDPSHYRNFRTVVERDAAGFLPVEGAFVPVHRPQDARRELGLADDEIHGHAA